MSFQAVSERLQTLQEANSQLRDLVYRLATINFGPGSAPLSSDDGEGNVLQELTQEISQTIRDQDEDFELLLEEVEELAPGKKGGQMVERKTELRDAVARGVRDLKTYVAHSMVKAGFTVAIVYRC